MKEALCYEKLENDKVKCSLCPKNCIIVEGKLGFCNARKNANGKLYTMVYGNLSSIAIDPVEKKPLYHFLPGTDIFSVGTFGCNLNCRHCQNFSISRALPPEKYRETTPEQLIRSAIASGCSSIAYTYNEPIIFYEYVIDSSKLAKNKGIKNVIVSNGFVNEKPLRDLCKFIDGANIDLKAFNDEFYREVTFSRLQPVLDALKILHEEKVWLEITNLVIPGLNDDMKEIKQMCEWIKGNIGTEHPLHFTAFYPCYKLKDNRKGLYECNKK